MNKEDLEQIKETINFALINSRFKDKQGFVFNNKAQTCLSKIEEQLLIQRVSNMLPNHVVKQLLHEAGNRASFMNEEDFNEWVESGW